MLCTCIGCCIILYCILVWIIRRFRIRHYGDRHVFITGCDSGFGNGLALKLDGLGIKVFAGCLTEKGAEKLQDKASKSLKTVVIDVTDEDDVAMAVTFVEEHLPPNTGLWAVVNNAGIFLPPSPIEWTTHAEYKQTIDVNVLGVVDVTRAFLPLIRKSCGRVVNVASLFGACSIPGIASYCVSKYGVEAFSDSLRREISVFGVSVHIIEPGLYATNMADTSRAAEGVRRNFERASPEIQHDYGREFMETIIREDVNVTMKRIVSPNLYKVVDAMTHAITARFPKYRYPVGWDAIVVARIFPLLPEWMTDGLMAMASKSRRAFVHPSKRRQWHNVTLEKKEHTQ